MPKFGFALNQDDSNCQSSSLSSEYINPNHELSILTPSSISDVNLWCSKQIVFISLPEVVISNIKGCVLAPIDVVIRSIIFLF